MEYETLVQKVESKECKLAWSKEEFKDKKINNKSIIKIISKCGHITEVQLSNFLYKNTGINCKECVYKQDGLNKRDISCDHNIQEYNVIKALQNYCKDLRFKIMVEGCLVDFLIQPKNESIDKWLPVQLKTTKSKSHGIYSFTTRQTYTDIVVILFSIEDQRIWILDGNIIDINFINIGVGQSIYSKYEIGSVDLIPKLTDLYYNSNFTKSLDDFNIPICDQVIQEQEFNRYRDKILPIFTYEYPEIDGRVYDVIINNRFKVQDKVITVFKKDNRNSNSWMVKLFRNRKYDKLTYKLGDNDFYWFHLPDKTGAYILPEQILFNKNLISNSDIDMKANTSLLLYPYYSKEKLESIKTGWLNDYLYFYEKDIIKIQELFNINNKLMLINDYICPIIIIDKSKPTFENIEKIIKKLVNNIFFNIIPNNKSKNLYIPIVKQKPTERKFIKELVCNIFKNVILHNENLIKKENKKNLIIIKDLVSNIFKNVIEFNKIKTCTECNCEIYIHNKSGLCRDCSSKIKFLNGIGRKVERPSYEQLLQEVEELNYSGTGRKYGVTDNSIRKWIKKYEKYI
jgi:hypothetical protein